MRQVTYEIKEVSIITKTGKNNKPYQVAHVTYRDDLGKLQERDIMPFGVQAQTHEKLKNIEPGTYTISLEKNDAGFNDWVAISTGGSVEPAASGKQAGASPAPRNTYETPEERALRQKLIVRQSSLTNAIALFELDKKRVPTVQDVVNVAKQFEDYVYGNVVKTATEQLTELTDDVPM